jgi:WD40 repeat protein
VGLVAALTWSPDGKTLASVNRDWNGVDLWDVGSGKHQKRLEGHKGRPTALTWSPDGEILASGGADRTVRLWKKTGEFVRELKDDQQDRISALAWLNGATLATFGGNNRLCVWNVAAEKLQSSATVPGTGKGRFSPDGRLLASVNDLAGVRLWETATGRPRGALFLPRLKSKPWMALSPEGVTSQSPWALGCDDGFCANCCANRSHPPRDDPG